MANSLVGQNDAALRVLEDVMRVQRQFEEITSLSRVVEEAISASRAMEEAMRHRSIVAESSAVRTLSMILDAPAWRSGQDVVDSALLRSMNAVTSSPTVLALHQTADRLAQFAFRDAEQLTAISRLLKTVEDVDRLCRDNVGLSTMGVLPWADSQFERSLKLMDWRATHRSALALDAVAQSLIGRYDAFDRISSAQLSELASGAAETGLDRRILASNTLGLRGLTGHSVMISLDPDTVDVDGIGADLRSVNRILGHDEPAIEGFLAALDRRIPKALDGAREAIAGSTHERTAKTAICLRRAIEVALDATAPIAAVRVWAKGMANALRSDGAPKRVTRIRHAFASAGIKGGSASRLMEANIMMCDEVFALLNGPCHTSTEDLDTLALTLLVKQVETNLLALAQAVRGNRGTA